MNYTLLWRLFLTPFESPSCHSTVCCIVWPRNPTETDQDCKDQQNTRFQSLTLIFFFCAVEMQRETREALRWRRGCKSMNQSNCARPHSSVRSTIFSLFLIIPLLYTIRKEDRMFIHITCHINVHCPECNLVTVIIPSTFLSYKTSLGLLE